MEFAIIPRTSGDPANSNTCFFQLPRGIERSWQGQNQYQLYCTSKHHNLQDRWADAQIFVKGVIRALDFGPVNEAKARELVQKGIRRARERREPTAETTAGADSLCGWRELV